MKNSLFGYFGSNIKKIGFFGLGKTNIALLKLLPLKNTAVVLRSDARIDTHRIPEGVKIEKIYECDSALDDISEDALILSPSVRRDRIELKAAERAGTVLSSDCELFAANVDPSLPVFGVTGSDGKSTTATLASMLLDGHFKNPKLCGNIGEPMLPYVDTADAFIAELSSFQLMYAKLQTRRAVITNITPNHLNWHTSFEEYTRSKLSIFDRAEELIICADDDTLARYAEGKAVFAISSVKQNLDYLKNKFSAQVFITLEDGYVCRNGHRLLNVNDIARREEYNLSNLAAAIALTDGYTDPLRIREVAMSFRGLRHRAEWIRQKNGVDYINSSIDTTPQRTAATLHSLARRCILILGGKDKGLSYAPLLEALKNYAKIAIVMGKEREKIIESISTAVQTLEANNMCDAVALASRHAKIGDAVLLSPSATSYDSYNNFEERGDHFVRLVLDL